jgi:hypothetical protein
MELHGWIRQNPACDGIESRFHQEGENWPWGVVTCRRSGAGGRISLPVRTGPLSRLALPPLSWPAPGASSHFVADPIPR